MANIEKRNGKYRVRWREGCQARSKACPDKRTAEELRKQVERCEALGTRWEPRTSRSEPTLEEAIAAYLKEQGRALVRRTTATYGERLLIFLRFLRLKYPRGPIYLDVLDKQLLGDFWDASAVGLHGNPRSIATRNKLVQNVQRWWKWCYDDERFEEWTPRPRTIKLSQPRSLPTTAPTWAQMDAVVGACTAWRRQLALTLRFTGLRVGQVMRLRWADIDLPNMMLRVRPELGKTQQEKRGRVVPLSEHFVEEITGWGIREGWLVKEGPNVKDRSRAARAEMMKRAWLRAGVPQEVWKQRPQHAFRKGFVTNLRQAGADHGSVEFLVGHDPGITGVYTAGRALKLREAVDLIPPVQAVNSAGGLQLASG